METGDSDSLLTLPEKGAAPSCRMESAQSTQDFVRRMIQNDSQRSQKRARLNGLVDGNPPYNRGKLAAAGRADACNVNWGTAKSTLGTASGGFYDLATEAPGIFSFLTSIGPPDKRQEWSSLACKFADKIIREDDEWDYYEQLSQKQMVMHGMGPYVFEDGDCIFPRAIQAGDLKVPEMTPANPEKWDACSIDVTYYPPQLFNFIQNEKSAKETGWDVAYTRLCIANAIDNRASKDTAYDWEKVQQQVKNNSFLYYDNTKVVRVSHVFWREFDGKITHAIVLRDNYEGLEIKYLYLRIGRYKSFAECIHPMYLDIGTNGYHHEVNGLGLAMYAALEYENRLMCNQCDSAFAPKILFKPTSNESAQKFSLTQLGNFAVMPAGFDWTQTGVSGFMNDGEIVLSNIRTTMRENISNFRGGTPVQKSGNPVTKFEKEMQAAEGASLNKTQFNRYYKQRDMLLTEMWRRLTNPSSMDEKAKKFQKRCTDVGIPIEALKNPEYIGACRVVGQGTAFTRKAAIDSLLPIAGTLPEEGRQNLITDKIAAEAGQGAIDRYYPRPQGALPTNQQQMALLTLSAMKTGIPAIVTSDQNPLVYASTFVKAAEDALNSLSKGASPVEVLSFLHLCGPAIAAQLDRMKSDPTRQQAVKALFQEWQKIATATDQLQAEVGRMMEQQQAQQAQTQQVMSDEQLRQVEVQSDIQIKTAKTNAQMQQSAEKHKLAIAQKVQTLHLADASTAASIARENAKAIADANKPKPSKSE